MNSKRTERPSVKKTRKKPAGVKKAQAAPVFIEGMAGPKERTRVESQQLFQTIFHASRTAMALSRLSDGRLIMANQSFAVLTGFESAEEMIGLSAKDVGIVVDEQVRQQGVKQMQAGVRVEGYEIQVTRRSGEVRHALLTSESFSIDGEAFALTSLVDITERKRAGDALQRNEQVLRLFVEHSPAAIAMFDREMRYIVASRRYLTDYRLAEQDLTGLSHYDVFPEMDEPRREIHRRCLAGEVVKCEEDPLPRLDGTLDYVRYELRPWYEANGSVGGLIFFSEVITERKQVEDQVQQMKRLYATLSQVNQTIVRVKTQGELYQSICDVAVKFGEFALAWVGLLDEETGDVRPVAANGLALDQWPFEVVNLHHGSLKDGLSATAIRTKKVSTSRDVQTDPRIKNAYEQIEKHAYHSSAAVPFRLGGKTIGVVLLVSPRVGLFDKKEEVLLLEEMGLDISFALDAMQTEKVKRQWADAFEHSGHGMVIGDPRTNRIITCNPAFAREQGSTVEALISMPLKDLYAPQDQERIGRLIAQADREGYAQFEANKVRPDGSLYPVQMDLVSVRDEGGELLYRVATQHDITQQKRAEKAMMESEEKYRLIADNANDWIYWVKPDGGFQYISPSCERVTGYTPRELMEDPRIFIDMVQAEDRARVESHHRDVHSSDEPHNLEYRIRTKSGQLRWISHSCNAVHAADGTYMGRNATSRDITERKRAEAGLRQSEEKFSKAFRASPSALMITRLADGEYLEINQAHCDIVGYERDELIGHKTTEFNIYVYPEQRKQIVERLLADGTLHDYEVVIQNKAGEHKTVLASLEVIQYNEEECILSSMLDITERKREQEGLRRSEEQYRTLFDHMAEGYSYCQMLYENGLPQDWVYLTVNPAFEKLTGLRDVTGKRVSQVIPGIRESDPMLFEIYSRVALNGGHEKFEMFVEAMQMWFSVSVYSSEAGFFVAMFDVITERKQTEKALERTRITLTEAQRIANLGSFEYIAAAQTTTWSEEEYRIYGLDPAGPSPSYEVMLQKCIHPDDAALLHETFTQAVQSRSTYELEHRIVRPDGSIRWVYDRAYPYFDEQGELERYIGATLDITERKLAEEIILANKATLDAALNSMTDAVIISDVEGNFLEFNDAFASFHRFKNRKECASTFAEYSALLEVFMADGTPAPVEKWAVPRALRGEVGTNIEYGLRRKDTGETWIGSYSFAPIRDGDGEITGSVVVARDISEFKSVERESRQRMEDLLLVNVLNDAANRDKNIVDIAEVFAHETRKVFNCQDVAIYLLSPDEKYIEMQTTTLSPKLAGRIERLIGRPIPKVRIPLRGDGYFRKLLSDRTGTITSDPKLIQQWIGEFVETTFLPPMFHSIVHKLVPQIYKLLNIRSTITIPLESHGRAIGMLDMSSRGMFTEEDLKRIRSISHQITAVILRKQAEAQIQRQVRRMGALGEIDRAISSTQDMQVSLDILLREGLPQLGVDAASVLLLNPASQALEYFSGRGFRTLAIRDAYITLGEGLAGRVGSERKMTHVSDLAQMGEGFRRAGLLKEEGFVEYFGVPLIAKGSLKGVMEVFNRSPLDADAEWVNYLETLGRQAAIAIDNAQLLEGMQRSNQELVAAYDATIAGWSRAMDLRDKETEGHTQRVTEVTVQLAKRMGVNQYEIVQLRRGALLHDIGKLGVPDHILLKPDKLTEIEWAMMRQHPTYAFNMLLSISYLRPALDIPYCHHEKWNGEGYPRGLKEEQIPLSARIFAIVDVWDALRSDRPYRKGWPSEQIIEYLREQSGKQFDPRVVEEFLKMIEEDPNLR